MKLKHIILLAVLGLLFSACQTPHLGYFQDVKDNQTEQMAPPKSVTIQPGDKLSILVSSKNPELAYLYNLPIVGHYSASTSRGTLSTSQVASYTVDESGNIDFPILGEMHIQGMTRSELAHYVKKELISKDQIKDATVTVDFLDLYFSVMGEVKNPGRFNFDRDQVTIIDALSRAGDLTIYGRRDNVLVMREQGDKQLAYRLDLTNAQSLYKSPAFYLQQNDVIYVEPNKRRAKESTEIGNAFSSPSLWISAASLIMSIIILVK